jgi:glycosyltransferase involved in cell wall biosynthesis
MSETVTVICTTLNEAHSIERLLASLRAQTLTPNEIIFVDGGSTDRTVAVLKEYSAQHQLPVRVIVSPGANISQGRNIAIEAATSDIIASTDAGVRLDPAWLEELLAPFRDDKTLQVVSGFFVPDTETPFEVAMGATVLPTLSDIDPESFLPSSRSVAYKKSGWRAVGGYPDWLDFCEDLIFDIRLRNVGGSFAFAPRAVVFFRPRNSLRTFFKQYYYYARGDGKSDLWRKRHAIRYLTYLVAFPLLILLGIFVSPWWWLFGLILGIAGMFLTPYRRLTGLWSPLSTWEKIQTAWWVPIIRVTGDIAKMIGYPVGLKWRLERLKSHPELSWR